MKTLTVLTCALLVLTTGVPAYADGTIDIAHPGDGNGWTFRDNIFTVNQNGSYTITGKGGGKFIEISSGVEATLTLDNMAIYNESSVRNAILLAENSSVVIKLQGHNIINVVDTQYAQGVDIPAGIQVSAGAHLLIDSEEDGTGSLDISTSAPNIYLPYGEAIRIGSDAGMKNFGFVTINGGTIRASGCNGTGIGGNARTSSETHIVINGGLLFSNIAVVSDEGDAIAIAINGGIVISEFIKSPDSFGSFNENIRITGGEVIAEVLQTNSNLITGGVCMANHLDVDFDTQTITLNAAFTIPEGETLIIPEGVTLDVNHQVLINNGTIICLGTIKNDENRQDNHPQTGKIPLEDSWIQIEALPQIYTGAPVEPAVTVKDWSRILIAWTDYMVEYSGNTNAGTARITVTGIGDYEGTISRSFTIEPKPIADDWLDNIPDRTYTGEPFEPAVTVWDGSRKLADTDYTVEYSGNTNAGTATATVTGNGNYTGMASKSFTIEPKPIAGDWLENIAEKTYTGEPITPDVTVNDDDKTLSSGTDYIVEYFDNTNAGTATVTVTGKDNYTGTVSQSFTIHPKPFTDDCWIETLPDRTYTGAPFAPDITVIDGYTTLTPGTDYTIEYSDNTNAGTVTVTATGTGNYEGTVSTWFVINPKPIAADWILEISEQTYTGEPVEPAVIVIDGYKLLTSGTDYTVEYSDNTNGGTATATVTGIGNYEGTATRTFQIIRNSTALQENWVQPIPDQYYTGSAIEPHVEVTGLTLGTDYTVTYNNNVNPGTAYATITGIGYYAGTITKPFTILPVAPPSVTYSIRVHLAVDANVENFVQLSFLSKDAESGTIVPLVIHIASGIETTAPVVFVNGSAVYVSTFDAANRNYTVPITVTGNMIVIVTGLNLVSPPDRAETADGALRVAVADGGLLISGLTPGESFGIYNLQGQPAYQGKATSSEEQVYLREKGIYILVAGARRMKAVY
ncbi:MAG: hypothetical protein MdMp024_0354 [Bacteroidales bacterium]